MDRFSRGCMGRTRNMAVLSPVRNVKIVFFITTFLLNTSSQKKGRLSTSPFFFLRAFQAGVPRVSPRGEETRDEAKRTRLGFFWEIQQHSTVCRCDLSKISSPRVAGFFFAFGVTEILLSGQDLYVLLFRVDRAWSGTQGKVSAPF